MLRGRQRAYLTALVPYLEKNNLYFAIEGYLKLYSNTVLHHGHMIMLNAPFNRSLIKHKVELLPFTHLYQYQRVDTFLCALGH